MNVVLFISISVAGITFRPWKFPVNYSFNNNISSSSSTWC